MTPTLREQVALKIDKYAFERGNQNPAWESRRVDALTKADAIIALLIPPGHVVVPVEPTTEMIEAGSPWTGAHHGPCDPNACAEDTYRAMLNAARPAGEDKP